MSLDSSAWARMTAPRTQESNSEFLQGHGGGLRLSNRLSLLQTAWILKLQPMHNQNRKIVSRGAAAVVSVEDEEGAISVGEPLAYNPTCVRRVGRHIPACDLLRQAFARPAGRGRRRAGRTWRRCLGDCLLANCQDFPPNGPVFGLRQSRHCRVEVPAPLPGIHI